MNRRRLADSASPGSKLNSIDESVALTDFSGDVMNRLPEPLSYRRYGYVLWDLEKWMQGRTGHACNAAAAVSEPRYVKSVFFCLALSYIKK